MDIFCKKCGEKLFLKKQLFKNKTIHIKGICPKNYKHTLGVYLQKTKENLLNSKGWILENEETEELDILLGLKENKIVSKCGNCDEMCELGCLCLCHWP